MEHWVKFIVLCSRFTLIIYFILSINSVYVSIPISQFILSPTSFPLVICMFVTYICVSTSALQIRSFIPYPRFHIYALIYDISFLTSLCTIVSRSIHVSANGTISLLFKGEYYSIVYIYHIFFIHSSVDGYFDYFHVLVIVNSAARNIGVHISFAIIIFSGYMPRSGIDGLMVIFLSSS